MEENIAKIISTTIKEVIKNSNLLFFDTVNLIFSVVAFIISIWSVTWTIHKNNNTNYKNNLYEDILKKPLHKELPMHIHKSFNINSKVTNDDEINKFEDFLMSLRKDILIFKYIDNNFYKKMEATIIKIDENIVLINAKKGEFDLKYNNIIKATKKLYKYTKKYLFK